MKYFDEFRELKRSDLEKKLKQAEESALTIVVAPMGYGKSTAINLFLEQLNQAVWFYLAMGQNEIDGTWIWQKLLNQGNGNRPVFEQLREIGFPRTKQQVELLLQTINNQFSEPFYLVLDDYQECNSDEINQLITRLVFERIENFHIIIVSRIYPDLSYGEMMLKGYCTIIDQKQLILSRDEIKEFFGINGVKLTESELDQVNNYTDGWISGAQLVLMEYKKSGKLKLSFGIVHLMRTAIYDKLSDELRMFLMKMSLFDQFTIEAACYTSECDITETELDEFVESVGFISYDNLTGSYIVHTLLRTVAAAELEKSGIDRERLYIRFAEWNLRHGEDVVALIYFGKVNDTEQICRILEKKERYLLFEKAPVIIHELFQSGDKDVWLRHPMTFLSYTYSLLIKGDVKEGMELYREGVKLYKNRETLKQLGLDSEWDRNSVQGEQYILESLVRFNQLDKMNECLKNAYEMLENNVTEIFEDVIMTYGVPSSLILYHSKIGSLRATIELEKEHSSYYMRLIKRIDGGWDNLFEAEYFLTIGNIAEAKRLAETVYEKAIFRKQVCMIISSFYIMMRCAVYLGDKKELETRSRQLEAQMRGEKQLILVQDWELAYGYVYGIIGKADEMAEWLKEFQLEECNYIVRCTRNGCICYGLYLIHCKKWVLLDALAEQMMVPFGVSNHVYVELYAYLYKAIAANYMKEEENAVNLLEKCLEIAEPDGIRFPFIELSPHLQPLLDNLKSCSAFVKGLIPDCSQFQKGLKSISEPEPDILTKRERELMELLQDGYRNIEIGEKLNIAPVTVEKTLTNIYRKLNVTNRTAAVNHYKTHKY